MISSVLRQAAMQLPEGTELRIFDQYRVEDASLCRPVRVMHVSCRRARRDPHLARVTNQARNAYLWSKRPIRFSVSVRTSEITTQVAIGK
jgi:hypothetical protein